MSNTTNKAIKKYFLFTKYNIIAKKDIFIVKL